MKRLLGLKLFLAGLGGVMVLLNFGSVGASSANISHSYSSSGNLKNGSLVSLDKKGSNRITLANVDNGNLLVGVVVNSEDSLLAVEPNSEKLQVATSGTVSALVSSLNGNIAVGDPVSVSPFNGVGSKAIPGARVIGIAQTSFSSRSQGVTVEEVADKDGHKKQIAVGFARVNIAFSAGSITGTEINGLQRFAASLTGRTVPTIRIVISLGVLLVTLLALITLIYASIYGGILSIGRNPLAKYTVFRTVFSVLAIAGAMSGVSAALIYFLLH